MERAESISNGTNSTCDSQIVLRNLPACVTCGRVRILPSVLACLSAVLVIPWIKPYLDPVADLKQEPTSKRPVDPDQDRARARVSPKKSQFDAWNGQTPVSSKYSMVGSSRQRRV